eukprot:6382714-Pyramimonas_sp.AAC.1
MRMRCCHVDLKYDRSRKLPGGSYLQVAVPYTRIPSNMWRCTRQTAPEPARLAEHELDRHGQGV